MDYKMKVYGQITRFEAGVFYKAWKNNKVNAYPEFAQMLYEEAERHIMFATERYNQDYLFYDNIERLTLNLLNEDYEKAQKIINEIQEDLIQHCGKKSVWYKYKK
jgi:hypothetical protein